MSYIIGDAVRIRVEPSNTNGATAILKSLKDPNGTEILTNQSMEFDSGGDDINVASVVWQSVKGTHDTGRYTYVVKVTRNSIDNLFKSQFFLEDD